MTDSQLQLASIFWSPAFISNTTEGELKMAYGVYDPAAMDAAAGEFDSKLNPKMTLAQLEDLWVEYYSRAGHKRMGRVIVNRSKARNKSGKK